MPSKSVGNTIFKITQQKSTATIYIKDLKIILNKELFYSLNLKLGQVLTDKEIKNIQMLTSVNKLFDYAINLLKKSHITEHALTNKLENKGASEEEIELVIKRLKNIDLINDEMYILDYIEYANELNYGKNKIIRNLQQHGIYLEQIKKNMFPISKEKKKALKNLKKLENRYSKYSYEKKRRAIYMSLTNMGFETDIILSTLEKLPLPDDKTERKNLHSDYTKLLLRYEDKLEGRKLKEKILATLKNKGYKVKDIKEIMEETYDY